MNEATWVVGCSEQRPNDVLAYEVMGIADGRVLLSRHDGVSYTTSSGEIRSYQRTRDNMLRLVLAGVPSSLRHGVGQALIRRWNRDWGVDTGADVDAGLAIASVCGMATEISISVSAAPISAGR